ncbi:MAG: molybdopterin-dependent oxidoreductase [Treponema sp.]|nr:molybdopterin-dependent oxidoreductase [Treponema sp.]
MNISTVTSLDELLNCTDLGMIPLAGGTDLLVKRNILCDRAGSWVDLRAVPELKGIFKEGERLIIGAYTTMSVAAEDTLVKNAATALAQAASKVGSWQIRNRATLGGNVANGSPAADTCAALAALHASVITVSKKHGLRELSVAGFFPGPNKNALLPGEIIKAFSIPIMPFRRSAFIKLGLRKEVAISRLNLGISADLKPDGSGVLNALVFMGTLGLPALRCVPAEEALVTHGIKAGPLGDALAAFIEYTIGKRETMPYKQEASRALAEDITLLLRGEAVQIGRNQLLNRVSIERCKAEPQAASGAKKEVSSFKFVGKRIPRADAEEKVRGRYLYLADFRMEGALYGALLLSDRANARVRAIDTSALPSGADIKVFTGADAPDTRYNSGEWFPGQKDHPDETLLTGHPKHIGDRIGLVLAGDKKAALQARALITVDYEELEPVVDIKTAAEKSELLHDDGEAAFSGRIVYGEVEAAFAHAHSVERDKIHTQKIHPGAMETHAALAVPRPEGVIEIQCPCQIAYGVQHAVAQVVPVPLSKIRIVKTPMGGSFGAKQEVVFEPLCAWAAWKLGKPVYIEMNRRETMLGTRTRAATEGYIETALDSEGVILGRRFDITVDAGAYLSGSKKVLMAMGKKASRLYKIPALHFEGQAVRTSTTPAGACRGYGSPQLHAITEIHTDLLCRRLGFDPVEFRMKNLVNPYDEDPSGAASLGNARIRDCLEQGLAVFDWEKRKHPSRSGRFRQGAGFACVTHGNGYYKTIYHDFAVMSMRFLEDGSVILRAGLQEMGNAATSAISRIVAEVTGIEPKRITITEADTMTHGYDIGCQASRGIFVLGECARLCAEKTLAFLLAETEKLWNAEAALLDDGFIRVGNETVSIGEAVRLIEMKNRTSIEARYEHRPMHNPASYAAHFVDLAVDTMTGRVYIDRYLAVHDAGKVIDYGYAEGQITGGVQMGIGMALLEDLGFDAQGHPSADNFDKYSLINAPDMPDVEVMFIEEGEEGGPFGAKSIGEIASVPSAPAIINAVNRALGTSLTDLPLSAGRIAAALH